MTNWSSPNLARATADSASIMIARSTSVAVARCSPRTAIGVSHESQSRMANATGWTNRAYCCVYSRNSHSSHLAMVQQYLAVGDMPNREPRVRSDAEGTIPESETCAGEHFSVAPAYTPGRLLTWRI